MAIVKPEPPMVVCCVNGADDIALNMVKVWIEENGFTSETHAIKRNSEMTWVILK